MPDALETVRERAKPWLQPIPGASPAGAPARQDPVYEAVAAEVAKLDLPAGGDVNWKKVVGGAGDLLKGKSKDVVLAAYLAHALHVTGGLDGLATGVTLMAELLDRFWDTAFPEPKRLRGRANAVQWFIEKSAAALGGASVGWKDAPIVGALDGAAQRLAEVVRARFADAAPAMRPLGAAIAQLVADVEAAKPPPPPAPAPAAAAPPPAAPGASPSAAAPAAPEAPIAPAGLASADDAGEFLMKVGSALVSAANLLRSASTSDRLAYRILRTGIWLHLEAEPSAEGGTTQIPSPDADLRAQLGALAREKKWNALLEQSEAAVASDPLWLDAHRFSAQALARLGSEHDRARAEIATQLRALLARVPNLPALAFSDGTPFADGETKAWLAEEVAATGGPAPAASGGDDAPGPDALERTSKLRELLAGGEAKEALTEMQALVAATPGGRARFRARLELARACARGGLHALARATYEALDREAVAHGLDEWEPALAAACLKELIAAARALEDDPRGGTDSLETRYQRLCRLDPAAAHDVWP